MMMAAARGRLSTVHALLAAGASVDTAGNKLRTPLIQATIGGHLPVVEALLAAGGADVRFRSVFDRRAAVHYAAEQGYAEIVSALLVGGAYKDPIGRGGVSPLSLATMNGHLTVVEILLAFGADLEVRNTAGETPLHVAAKGVHEGILATLLCAGAHKNALDNHGMSPLTCAAKEGHVGEALLAAGSNLSFRRKGVPRYNALDWAVDRGDVHVVEALIGRGANVDAYYRGGLAALHVAAWKGHAGAAEALIKAGANFELKSGHKPQPHFCVPQTVARTGSCSSCLSMGRRSLYAILGEIHPCTLFVATHRRGSRRCLVAYFCGGRTKRCKTTLVIPPWIFWIQAIRMASFSTAAVQKRRWMQYVFL